MCDMLVSRALVLCAEEVGPGLNIQWITNKWDGHIMLTYLKPVATVGKHVFFHEFGPLFSTCWSTRTNKFEFGYSEGPNNHRLASAQK